VATSSGELLNPFFFPGLSINILDQDAKWLILRLFLAKVALFLLSIVFSIFLLRCFTKKIAPALDEDPTSIKLLNRVLLNSLEQAAIFGGLYFYFLFDKAGDSFSAGQLIVFGSWFLLGRVCYLITYSLGTYLNMVPIRAYGFGINLFLAFLLA
jgi:hypothetical protein